MSHGSNFPKFFTTNYSFCQIKFSLSPASLFLSRFLSLSHFRCPRTSGSNNERHLPDAWNLFLKEGYFQGGDISLEILFFSHLSSTLMHMLRGEEPFIHSLLHSLRKLNKRQESCFVPRS